MGATVHLPPTTETLISGGFSRAGKWEKEPTGSIVFKGKNALPREGGVYVYLVQGKVQYIGSAKDSLRSRLRHYESSKSHETAIRVRNEILSRLAVNEPVEVFTIVPTLVTTEHGLPIDAILGLEHGLIQAWQPAWNKRGVGKRK